MVLILIQKQITVSRTEFPIRNGYDNSWDLRVAKSI